MSGYVVDTNVLSRRGDVQGNPDVDEWLRRYASMVWVSVVTVAEMHRGLLVLQTKIDGLTDRQVRARQLRRLEGMRAWYNEVTQRFSTRIQPIDVAVAEKWAEVSTQFPSLRDGDKAIAATALAKGWGVATENLGDFKRLGVSLMNPFNRATWDDEPTSDADPVMTL